MQTKQRLQHIKIINILSINRYWISVSNILPVLIKSPKLLFPWFIWLNTNCVCNMSADSSMHMAFAPSFRQRNKPV